MAVKITWHDGEVYFGKNAREVVQKMSQDSPFEWYGPLFLYSLDVAKACWKFGYPVRPWPYITFIKDLKKYDIISEKEIWDGKNSKRMDDRSS